MTVRSGIEAAAVAFWRAAGGREAHRGDIELAVATALPAAVVRVADLTTTHVESLMTVIGATPWLDTSPRPLRGCVVAGGGKAVILVCSGDEEEERRLTIAHEAAHLLLHYLRPRERALRAFGERIRPVLDGLRAPTPAERLSSAMRDVPLSTYRHAMERRPHAPRSGIEAMEDEADDLAIELLAPMSEVRALRDVTPGAIRQRFGIPALVAMRLATTARPDRPSRGVVHLLGAR